MEAPISFLASIITISFFLIMLPESLCKEDEQYLTCQYPFNCGTVRDIGYPSWSDDRPRYCGSEGFHLNCPENEYGFPSIRIDSQTFNVTRIGPLAYDMTIVRTDLVYDDCSSHLKNISLGNLFSYEPNVKNVTLFYDCPQHISIGRNNFTCQPHNFVFYGEEDDDLLRQFSELNNCERRILVPVSKDTTLDPQDGIKTLKEALPHGFDVKYTVDETRCKKCLESGGMCGSDDKSQFTCHCQDGPHALDCSDSSKISGGPNYRGDSAEISTKVRDNTLGNVAGARGSIIRKVIVGGVTGALLICIVISFGCKIKSMRQKIEMWETPKVDQNIEAFIRNHEPLALTRYKFADVKKMTNSFEVKLGQGGYGVVYKGKLLNDYPVAVKILEPSKGNGEDFINEVASISKTSHVNVVTLLGFCLKGRKKALIYEFMANGSLEKFISSKANKTTPSLTWENLNQIAIGTARGLEYLHRGCNTRILHFYIKPHNILLDESFCPKISDFGLAKLCPNKESIISISEARGTIGYLAPEVWNRNIGRVSHKSDIYSYGMMLLDMVGGRKNINAENNCTTEIYFPDWIYDKLEQDSDLGHDGVNTMEENDMAKRMTIVGLWCIQTFPTQRATISRVIDMLEGSLESLEMPPKPVMSSPTRLELESSTTTNTMTY